MTELELARQRIEALVDRWRHHPDRIEPADACDQILAALDEPLPLEEPESSSDCDCGVRGCVWGHY